MAKVSIKRSGIPKQQLRLLIQGNLQNAGRYSVKQIRKKLNVRQPVVRTARGELRGLDPSLPGEPPKRVTGRLRRSVYAVGFPTSKYITLRVGATAPYTSTLEPPGRLNRPFLLSTLMERRRSIQRILARGKGKLRAGR